MEKSYCLLNKRLVAGLLCAWAVSAQAQYTVSVLSAPGWDSSFARGISSGKVVGSTSDFDNIGHAIVWQNGSATDVHPSGYESSHIYGTSNGVHAGYGRKSAGRYDGIVWTGSDVIEVSDSRFNHILFRGTDGTQTVGEGILGSQTVFHALLWQNGRLTDLHPQGAGVFSSESLQVAEGHQVGYAVSETTFTARAAEWNGCAASYLSLHPAGYDESYANGIAGEQVVGQGYRGIHDALMWNGPNRSLEILTPEGWVGAFALGTNGSQQVGYGLPQGAQGDHATVWNGSRSSFIDLHQFVPPTFTGSRALAIDENGVIVGYGFDTNSPAAYRALQWTPIPELETLPACAALLGSLILARGVKRGTQRDSESTRNKKDS